MDALPILFLNGVGSDKSAWRPQLAHFGQRALAFDYPGYGDRPLLGAGDGAAHDRFAGAMLAALDTAGIERVHVCGLSLGGVVAIAMANQAAERIASLVLADTFAQHPDGSSILARTLASSADMAAMSRARVPALLAPDPDPALVAELERVMARIDPAAFRAAATAVWPADQRERAARIACPTLVLCGREDRVTPPRLSEELATLVPGAQLALIDGAGHLPNLEQPERFNAALDAFLAEL